MKKYIVIFLMCILCNNIVYSENTIIKEIISLNKEKVSTELILTYIENKKVGTNFTSDQIILLKNEKVHDDIIKKIIIKSDLENKANEVVKNEPQRNYEHFQRRYLLPRARHMIKQRYQ